MQYFQAYAVNHNTGATLPGATIQVYNTGTTTPAVIYDATNTLMSNPFTADSQGLFGFAAADGEYDVQIVSGTYTAPPITRLQLMDNATLAANIQLIATMGVITVAKDTRANLYADLAHAAGVLAMVYADSTPNYNGVYIKLGASGAGSWSLTTFPYSAVLAQLQPIVDLAVAAQVAAEAAATNAVTAAASISPTIITIGNPGPITGSAVGNTTYILDPPAPEDMTITLMYTFGLGSGGNVKIKAADIVAGAWSMSALQTKTVAAGAVSTTVSLTLLKGQRIAIYASGVIGSVGNGGPITPYWTLAGDVLSGAIGAQTTNTSLGIGFKLVSATRLADVKTQATDNATSEVRTRSKDMSLVDLGSSLSSSTVYYDPRANTAGVPQTLKFYGRAAGWATVYLAKPSSSTQWDVYRRFDVYVDVGVNTITQGSTVAGKGIPMDLVFEPGTISGALCPSGGGQIAWTNTDGPGTVGENLIGYRLPQGNYTGTATAGVQTLTWSATSNRQLAMEWSVLKESSPRKLNPQPKVFLNETFPGTTLPIYLMANGTLPTFSAGKAVSAATGFGNVLRHRFGHALHKHARECDQKFGSGSSVVVCDIRPITGGYGSSAKADCAANTWSVFVAHGAVSSTPAINVTRTWPGTFNAATSFLRWRWERNGRIFRITLTDYGAQPIVSDYYEVDVSAANVPPLVTNPSDWLNLMGQLNGSIGSLALSGSVETYRLWDVCTQRNATGIIIGDSIANASRVAYVDGWPQKLEAARAVNGQQTAIMAVDGWTMDDGCNTFKNAVHLLPDLEWGIIALGTNRSAAAASDPRDQNMFEASARALLYEFADRGIKPYYMSPSPHTYSPGATTGAARTTFMLSQGVTCIRGDKATTQADGVTINTSYFYNNGVSDVHYNTLGHQVVYNRLVLDAPELLL